MRFLKRTIRDEKGASVIMVAIALVVIFGFAVLTIDLSLMQLAKIQLQNAADAAALAGAMALALATTDREAVATAEAIRVAGLNVAVQDIQRPVIIDDADVFIDLSTARGVTVTTHRTIETGDPVTLYFLRVLGDSLVNLGEVRARATAEYSWVCGTDCLRPFCPPDRWEDLDDDGTWDPGEPYDAYTTGYKAPDDIGALIILELSAPDEEPIMNYYYAVRFAPLNTGDPVCEDPGCYPDWITGCEPYMVTIGDELQIEPNSMVGLTTGEWLDSLISKDPVAEWDPATGTVINSTYPSSPRIIKICAFDPTRGVQIDGSGRRYVTVSKIMAMFIEPAGGNQVVGRLMRTTTQGITAPICPGHFLFNVALVE